MTHPTRLTGPLTHTYRVTPGQLFAGAGLAITAIRRTRTASTGPTKLTVHYKIGRNPHEPCMRCMDACIPLVGLSALSYSLQDPRESCVTFVACSKGSKCPHERALTFPRRHEVCNEQMRLMSASRRVRGLATTHIILYLVYNTHIYLICPTYPPQRTRGCLTSTPSRLAALICQRVPQQRQPTSAGAY